MDVLGLGVMEIWILKLCGRRTDPDDAIPFPWETPPDMEVPPVQPQKSGSSALAEDRSKEGRRNREGHRS